MSFSYMFKFIIIGDTGTLLSISRRRQILPPAPVHRPPLSAETRGHHRSRVRLQNYQRRHPLGQATNLGHSILPHIQAGQETFKSITRSYYRGSIGVVLVYDITNRESFSNINKWLDETKAYSNDKITSFLVGNKSDLENKYFIINVDDRFLMMKALI